MDSFSVLHDLAWARHSCRAFLDKPVPRERIELMLDLAARAPSDCNTQPWRLFILSGDPLEDLRQALFSAARAGTPPVSEVPPITSYTGEYQDRRRACGWGLYEAVGIVKGDRAASAAQALENFRFFGAPHFAVITSPRALAERGIFDTGIFLGQLMLAAQALGIATLAQGAVAHHADVLRRHVPVPETDQIICGLSFGYADIAHPANSFRTERTKREDFATILG